MVEIFWHIGSLRGKMQSLWTIKCAYFLIHQYFIAVDWSFKNRTFSSLRSLIWNKRNGSTSDNVRNRRYVIPGEYVNLGGFECIKCKKVLSKDYAGCDAAVSQESISPVWLPEFFYLHTHGTDNAAIPVNWLLKYCIKENDPYKILHNIKCIYCFNNISYTYNLTDMWHHLVNKHEAHLITALCDRPITNEAGPSGLQRNWWKVVIHFIKIIINIEHIYKFFLIDAYTYNKQKSLDNIYF